MAESASLQPAAGFATRVRERDDHDLAVVERKQYDVGQPVEQEGGNTRAMAAHAIVVQADSANVPDGASRCAIDRRDVTESSEAYELSNVVETALAKALVLAAAAKRWDVVSKIADELQRRGTAIVEHRLLAQKA